MGIIFIFDLKKLKKNYIIIIGDTMMNKRGFTFVELLSVMTLIAVLGLIAFPSVTSLLKKATDNKYESFLSNVYVATEAYIQDYIENYPQLNETGGVAYVYMAGLVANNYLKSSLSNPKYCVDDNCSSKRISTCRNNVCRVDDYTIVVTKTEIGTYAYELKIGLLKKDTIGDITKSLVYRNDSCATTDKYMDGCYSTGAQTNNYVYYNNSLWRIMGLNSDNTVRLIANESVNTSTYNNLSDWYDSYYDSLKIKDIISTTSYCADTFASNTVNSATCTNVVSKKVYSLSVNEYNLAGSNSYLKPSASFISSTSVSNTNVWQINAASITSVSKTATVNVRPVISVSFNSTLVKGSGTSSDPYYLSADETNNMNGEISSSCSV